MISRLPDAFGADASTKYFTAAALFFVLSFLVLPTSKMVNNVYYLLLALPAVFALPRHLFARRVSLIEGLWLIFLSYFAMRGLLAGDVPAIKHVLYVGLFVFILGRLVSHEFFRSGSVARVLFWTSVGYVIINALWLWGSGELSPGDRVLWLSGRMAGPIYTSMWVALCFALCIPTWRRERSGWEALLGLLSALLVCGYVLQSRSGLVGLSACALLLAPTVIGRYPKYSKPHLIGLLLLICGLIWLTLQLPLVSSLWARGDSYRLELWQAYFSILGDCGLWQGCGVDYSPVIELSSGITINHPHNVYISLALYGGLPGALLFLCLMGTLLFHAARTRNIWGLALLLGLLMVNFDGHRVLDSPNELWLLLLLPAGLISAVGVRRAASPGGAIRSPAA